ncbi:hypothetical protein BUALT_Bualt02G0218200 [Buddleja alternifolia]|uniref:SMP domain-containing protein n=1 Tax=Buddleja alternifolia TaxID=168488 RepID=A0AAV6Y282_9LAMI|nr:hypothetical protein BUALT_Bualt02G0218200 [Buddleja alternifolia]
MSQEQPQRPQAEQESIKYGDVFQVSGELASQPVAPKDADTAQAAECIMLGHTQKGGPAAVMQSAADANVKRGVLSREDVSEAVTQHGVCISQSDVAGSRVITEALGGEVLGKFVVAEKEESSSPPLSALSPISVTIGQALESVAMSAGDKSVDESDAAAIQAVENRATGRSQVIPGGVAAKAQSAAINNARTVAEDKKIKLRDVLADATTKLPDDKVVTEEDADAAVAAEIRNKADMSTYTGGVAASMVEAARINQKLK